MPQPFQRTLALQSQTAHFGAPTGGWNALDNITAMAPTDAVRMINLFPDTTAVRLRRGSVPFCTISGVSGTVPSLMTWSTASTQKLIAAAGGAIYDVTTGTAASVASGFSSDVWQYINMSTPGGQFLIAVNGTGKQWIYDGTTWVPGVNTLGPTGSPCPDSNTFCSIALFDQRLFFATSDSTYIYYLPVNVYQGELHAFDAGAFLPKGGGIADIGSWTMNNSTGGVTNLLVIVSTMGEVLVYQGINPDDATNWAMVGRFAIGLPVSGHRALTRLGPDAMLICEDGFQPLSQYLSLGQTQALNTAISRKIGNAVTQAVRAGKNLFGWEAILYPANNAMIVNVPQPGGNPVQYVVNTITGSWTQFQGLNAQCWALFQDRVYFGSSSGTVWTADTGTDDNGQPIVFDLVTSFQLPGGSAQKKRALMCRPFIMLAGGAYSPALDVNVDYNIMPVSSPIGDTASGTDWDAFAWDMAAWGSDTVAATSWYSVCGLGTAFAVRINGQAIAETFQLLALDLTYEPAIGVI